MKTLPLILAAFLGISVTGVQAETAPPIAAKSTPTSQKATPAQNTTTAKTTSTTTTNPKEFNVLVVHNNPAIATPTQKTVFGGKSVFLVGTADEQSPRTKVECCFDQYGKIRGPITGFDNLKIYDLTKDGKIDANEAGYSGLLVGVATPKENTFKVMTFKEAGIKSITLPGATNTVSMVEFTNQTKSPLVAVKITPDK